MQDNRSNQSAILTRAEPSLLATHKVLRNTYFLLSLTLLFSGLMAAVAMKTNAPSLGWLALLGSIGLLFLTMALRNSVWGLLAVFAFTGFWGYTMGPFLNMYIATFANGMELIMTAMGGTGAIFLALSAYVLVSKKDFSFLGGFLFVGVIAILITLIIGFFFPTPALQLIVSAVSMIIFSGYILYDTSAIIRGGETNYIMATVRLFMDILIIFQNLLMLLGALSGRRN